MKIELVSEKANPLMKRKELVLSIEYNSSTPSKAEMQLAVSKQFGAEAKKVEIKKILSTHGKASGKAWVSVWEDKEIPIYGKKAEPKTEEAPKEAPAEEKPAEEKPAEKPKEESKTEEAPVEEPKAE